MKEINKNVIFVSLIALVVAGIIKYNPSTDNKNISVSGTCSKKIKKDKFGINIQIKNVESDSQKAMVKTLKTYNDVSEFLKKIQKDNPDLEIETTEYTTSDKMEWNEVKRKSEKVGVEFVIGLSLKTSNPKVISDITANLTMFNNIYTSGLNNFVSSELYNKERDNCLTEAVKDAQIKAKVMASAVDQSIGKMTNITYDNYSTNGVGAFRSLKAAAAFEPERMVSADVDFIMESAEIFSGFENISLKVDATFELK